MVLYKEIDEFSEMLELDQIDAEKIKTRVAQGYLPVLPVWRI